LVSFRDNNFLFSLWGQDPISYELLYEYNKIAGLQLR
jgi:hypothetical protein